MSAQRLSTATLRTGRHARRVGPFAVLCAVVFALLISEARSLVSRSSDLYEQIEECYDQAFDGKQVCAPEAKLFLSATSTET